jgi:hypothetical protein
MTAEQLNHFLDLLKTQYLHSKQISLKNFLTLNNIMLPEEINVEQILHWNKEKREFLRKASESILGLQESYIKMLLERLDVLMSLQDKLMKEAMQTNDVKDLKTISASLKEITQMYDETINRLQVDTTVNKTYDENRSATDDLLFGFDEVEPDELEPDQD